MSNIVTATFRDDKCTTVYTRKVSQFDKGLILRISGVALPETYQVHFSNDPESGVSIAVNTSGSDVTIPEAFLMTGKYVYAWIYTTEGILSGTSDRMIVIPVVPRPAHYVANDGGGGGGTEVTYGYELDEDGTLRMVTYERPINQGIAGYELTEDGTLVTVPANTNGG